MYVFLCVRLRVYECAFVLLSGEQSQLLQLRGDGLNLESPSLSFFETCRLISSSGLPHLNMAGGDG